MIPINVAQQKRVPRSDLLAQSKAEGDDLGRVLAESPRSVATRIAVSLIFAVAMSLPYLAWIEDAKLGASIAWAILLLVWISVIVGESRRHLAIHANGIAHQRAFGRDTILWHAIKNAVLSYSYSIDPRALFRIDIVTHAGKKYGLDLNWKNKKELVPFLDQIFVVKEEISNQAMHRTK